MSAECCTKTVVSIFVNPTQFNQASDFEKYPKTEENDYKLCKDLVDIVFMPSVDEMYPVGCSTFVINESPLTSVLEGAHRPGHFKGVLTVVSKLFNIISPNFAFFGQKDIQQVKVVEALVKDILYPVKIVVGETLREENGLAMSSRNIRLSSDARWRSGEIYRVLKFVAVELQDPKAIVPDIVKKAAETLSNNFKVDYFAVTDSHLRSIDSLRDFSGEVIISTAVFIEDVRLIDNISVILT